MNWLAWLPENVSTYGADVDGVIAIIWYTTVVWFFLTFGTLGAFLILYRRRPGRPAAHVRGERLREAAWILVPSAQGASRAGGPPTAGRCARARAPGSRPASGSPPTAPPARARHRRR